VVVGAIAVGLPACAPALRPVDLLRPEALVEATVAGRGSDWVAKEAGRLVRLNDVVRRTLPASPPSRLRFALDIPPGAHLNLACGIALRFQDAPGVEFVVKVREDGREDIVFSTLVDPLNRPAHHEWVPADIDLSRHSGRGRELVLETRGFETAGEPERAFWGAPALTTANREAPVAIIYLVDTLRADHTTPYGYKRQTTPELAAFARDAVVFDSAIAQASWTKPSVASILTSELPGLHRAVQLRDPLDSGQVTLAEMLQVKGFATGAAIANWVIYSEGNNFEQGFDVFVGLHGPGDRPSKLVEAAGVVDASLAWLDARRGLPVFLYAHTMDPHVPYAAPPPFDRAFGPPPAEGRAAADPRTDYKGPPDRDRLIAQYDGEIAYGDREFGRFVRELKKRGLYDRALIAFMGDHGEEFQDHGGWLHGRSVFDELVRIPLIVKFPRQRDAGRRIAQQVQSVDVLPTILENAGLPVPPSPVIAGLPLQGVLTGEIPERPAVSEISHRGFVAHGMRTGRDKYIRRFSPEQDELYFDLVRDPLELTNRIDEARERVRVLKASVEAAMVQSPFRYTLRVVGGGDYALTLSTGGWIEGTQATGLGPSEGYAVEANGRRVVLRLSPRPGQPREVTFGLRPIGVHVDLSGTRAGRPLQAADLWLGAEGAHPASVPFTLPDPEAEAIRAGVLSAPPPAGRPGVQVWLTMTANRRVLDLDQEARERLKALGYLGPN
jgi:arylsulfatase A-like enzyme